MSTRINADLRTGTSGFYEGPVVANSDGKRQGAIDFCALRNGRITRDRFPFEQVRWGFTVWRLGILTLALVSLVATPALAQTTSVGRLDFLKSKDASFALFANTSTSNTGQPYPNDL